MASVIYKERLLKAAHEVMDTAPADNPMGGIKPEQVVAIASKHNVTVQDLDEKIGEILDEGFRTYVED